MYSTMDYTLYLFFDFPDSGVGGGVLFSWLKLFLFIDVQLISLKHNVVIGIVGY